MVTGFDYLGRDKALQEHWLRRFVAIVIDGLLIYGPISALFMLLGMSLFFPWWWAGAFLFLYASLFDLAIGGTVGKRLMRLKTVSLSGQLGMPQAFMRNVSKVFAPLLLLDWVIGMAIDTQDPRQKFTDHLGKTSVILY